MRTNLRCSENSAVYFLKIVFCRLTWFENFPEVLISGRLILIFYVFLGLVCKLVRFFCLGFWHMAELTCRIVNGWSSGLLLISCAQSLSLLKFLLFKLILLIVLIWFVINCGHSSCWTFSTARTHPFFKQMQTTPCFFNVSLWIVDFHESPILLCLVTFIRTIHWRKPVCHALTRVLRRPHQLLR